MIQRIKQQSLMPVVSIDEPHFGIREAMLPLEGIALRPESELLAQDQRINGLRE